MKRIDEINKKGYVIHIDQNKNLTCDIYLYHRCIKTCMYCKIDCYSFETALQEVYEFVMNQ